MSQVRNETLENRIAVLVKHHTPVFMGNEPCDLVQVVYDTIKDVARVRIEGRGLTVRFTTEKFGALSHDGGENGTFAGCSPNIMAKRFGGLSAVTTMLITASPLATYMRWVMKGKKSVSPLFAKSPLYFTLEFSYTGRGLFPTPNLSQMFVRDLERTAVYEVPNMDTYMNAIGYVGTDAQTHADMVDKIITSHPINRHVAFAYALAAQERWCINLEPRP